MGLVSLLLLMGCRASRVLFPEIHKEDTDWLRTESRHYFIYYRPASPASRDIDNIAKTLDSCFEDVLSQLEVDFSNKISYYLYNSPDDLERWADWKRWGFFVGEFQYAVGVYASTGDRISSHETAHVIVYHTIGIAKLIFLNEGLAEAVTHYHDRNPITEKLRIHEQCRSLLYRDALFPLDVLAENDRFRGIYLSPEVHHYYRECGSFARYLVDQYGLDKFKFLLPRADEDNYKDVFQEIYGMKIYDFEEEWHEFLRNY